MSAEAIGWVWKNSTYEGSTLLVQLAIADSANDQNDNEIWMTQEALAAKARVTDRTVRTALSRMMDDGYLVQLEDRRHRHLPSRYMVVFDWNVVPLDPGQTGNGFLSDRKPVPVQGNPTTTTQTPNPSPSVDADRLCALLAELMVLNGVKPPRITDAWLRDMDRIMRLDGRTPAQVERMIRWCQADPFWMANIHSPKKLREKYDTMKLRASSAARPSGRVAPVTQTMNVLREFGYGDDDGQEGHGNGAGDLHGQLAAQGT